MFTTPKKVVKIVFAGNDSVGKTTLMKRFCYGKYYDERILTVGSDIFVKKYMVNNETAYIVMWDFGGSPQFRFFLDEFLKGAAGAILAFEVDNRKTFTDLGNWLNLLRERNPNLPIVLIGTKLDIGYDECLEISEVESFVNQYNILDYKEISSKDQTNIEWPFRRLLQHLEKTSSETITFLDYE